LQNGCVQLSKQQQFLLAASSALFLVLLTLVPPEFPMAILLD